MRRQNGEPVIDTALQQFLGRNDAVHINDSDRVLGGADPCVPVIAWNSGKRIAHDLAARGYTNRYSFAVLPSLARPRWLLPMDSRQQLLQGLAMYVPHSRLGRLLKSVLRVAGATGWQGWARHRAVIMSNGPLMLERLVTEITGEAKPLFALSLGSASRYRKLTIQVMNRSGEVLGYIKCPLTPAAVERVRHEATMLAALSSVPALRRQIPRLLYQGEWNAGYFFFQSRGPAKAAPLEFGPLHREFLHKVWEIGRVQKAGSLVVAEVAERWRRIESHLDPEWRDLGGRALERARQELKDADLACGLSHGDFAPWNVHLGDGQLFVFDWESARHEAPILWDVFHFHVQVGNMLKKWNRSPGIEFVENRGSFLLYIIHSVCQLLDETPPDGLPAIEFRRQILASELA